MAERSALDWGREIEAGRTDPRELTETFLARIEEAGLDTHIYYRMTETRAREEAAAAADRARRGTRLSPLDGVPLSWKDLFDTAGIETPAGSKLLAGRVPQLDAAAVARATRMGLVCLGKTAMTELAFSGLGINPVYGTPANAYSEDVPLAPGGSSSGAAVALARGMCAASIGTDTGGSVRIPSAWNALVGFKPSFGSVPNVGVVPLCPSLDTVGPLARDVADAAALFAILADRAAPSLDGATLSGHTVLVPDEIVWDETGPGIADAVEAALKKLEAAGATLKRQSLPALAEMNRLTWESGISLAAVEAWSIWGPDVEAKGGLMYPPVRTRMESGRGRPEADVEKLIVARKELRRQVNALLAAEAAAIAMPTVAIDPPPIAELEDDDAAYGRANRLALRNTTLGNQLDWCGISLPAGRSAAGLPVGLMLCAPNGADDALLSLAAAAEKALAS